MKLAKTINILIALCLFAIVMPAKAQRLPEAHIKVAERAINSNVCVKGSFTEVALEMARINNPFEELRLAVLNSPAPVMGHPLASKMVNYAERFLGTRYVWGASGPNAFDCSGFVGYVYRNFGIKLHRSSSEQYTQGERVSMDDLNPGDLLFFSSGRSGRGRVGHVAMVVSVDKNSGSCTFIHASTKRGVVYQRYPDNGYYQSHFMGARRILGTSLESTASVAAE